jgi:hypothetical protein
VKHVESDEQVAFFKRCSYRKYSDGTLRDYIFSVPNALPRGGKAAMLQMLQLKREGLTKGIPDIECFEAVKPYTGLHIEMKKPDGKPGDVTDEQRTLMKRLTACGRKCVVAYGADHAWKELCNYLGIKE